MDFMMIGDVLKQARNTRNISQTQLAEMIGVTKQTYLKWENGTTEPKASQVVALSNALGVSASEICTGKLNKRYSLEDFLKMSMRSGAPSELKTLITWELLDDHEKYIKQITEPMEETYLSAKDVYDIEKQF